MGVGDFRLDLAVVHWQWMCWQPSRERFGTDRPSPVRIGPRHPRRTFRFACRVVRFCQANQLVSIITTIVKNKRRTARLRSSIL